MKRTALVTIILLFLYSAADAQWFKTRWKNKRNEIGGGIGVTNFMGDLGGANKIGSNGISDFDFRATRPTLHVDYRYYILQSLAAKAGLTYGWVGGSDENTEEQFRNNRNAHFRSPIVELAAQVDWFFFEQSRTGQVHNLKGARGALNMDIGFYIFAGVSGFYFNPKAKLTEVYNPELIEAGLEADNKWYALRKIGTEGQGYFPTRKKYSPISVAVPFGLGIRHNLNSDMSIEFEYGFRKTFTDYIDDVSTSYVDPDVFEGDDALVAKHFSNPSPSADPDHPLHSSTSPGEQRGNPKENDAYMFGIFSFKYKLTSNKTHGSRRKIYQRNKKKSPRRKSDKKFLFF